MFVDKLIEKIKQKNNPSVLGLDPRLEFLPGKIKKRAFSDHENVREAAAAALLDFGKQLIDAVYDLVPAVKPQLAYYEMYGVEGSGAFQKTVEYAKSKGLLVIADAKKNDIGSTAEAYSNAYLGRVQIENGLYPVFDTDAITVNPYLGYDGIKPFIEDCSKFDKGIFILVKTSNKSSGLLQDLVTEHGKSIYEIVAEQVESWGKDLAGEYGYSSIGAVVGATYPNQAKRLRNILKRAYILVPGYGAQGGTARDAAHCFNTDGLGAVVNASRSIMYAWKSEKWSDKYGEDNFGEAARNEVIRMRDELNDAIGSRKG